MTELQRLHFRQNNSAHGDYIDHLIILTIKLRNYFPQNMKRRSKPARVTDPLGVRVSELGLYLT